MSRKFGFGKPSPGDDETTDAKGEKNEVSQDADAMQAVTPPLTANPLRHASDGAQADPTKGPAATDAADEDASGMLAYQNLERHRKEKRRRRNVKIVVGACAAVVIAAAIIVPRVLTPADAGKQMPATAEVTRGDLTSSVSVTGAAQPASSVYVTPEVSGIVQDLRVSEGDTVGKGDVPRATRSTARSRTPSGRCLTRRRRSTPPSAASTAQTPPTRRRWTPGTPRRTQRRRRASRTPTASMATCRRQTTA